MDEEILATPQAEGSEICCQLIPAHETMPGRSRREFTHHRTMHQSSSAFP